ncbi:Lon protease [Candidatus Izimaplasma bacterium HR1]|jgi:PDZ domain-containing protein|uniref:S16 family serine protease n=1 Tax=Candidatus Izimoplasma sp. HR1 TaxID=1541959 RepID=UPI0004F7DF68|nr:Lon protease [Candidatus Izimaplasma bacterium HR1]
MKTIFLKHKVELAILSFFLLVMILITSIKVDYTMTAPGYNNEVSSFITIDDSYEQEGSFHTTSVIVVREMSILQKYFADKEDKIEVDEIPTYYTYVDDHSDINVMGYQMKDDSIANALVVGIEASNQEIEYTVNDVVYLIYNYMTEDTLEIGDIVISINDGNPYTEAPLVGCEEVATFEIVRNDETMLFELTKNYYDDEKCGFGLYINPLTEIISSEVDYKIHNDFTMGPSGGLMQSLYVFNLLTPNDITGGKKIAGTGTINDLGQVGAIGGIEQKIITSAMNGIDIFFVPHLSDSEFDNYIMAKAILETLDTDMKLIPVDSFDDARSYLESKFGGAFDE